MPDFFSHLMAHRSHHHHSRTSEVRASNSWTQDNPLDASCEAQDYDAHRHCTHNFKELTAEHFAQDLSDLVSHGRKVTNPDSRQLCREVRRITNCFLKQIAALAGSIASSPPLHVKRHAYSSTAGHVHQHLPSPKENGDVRLYDAQHIERPSTLPTGQGMKNIETTTKGQHRVKVIRREQKAVGHQAPQEI